MEDNGGKNINTCIVACQQGGVSNKPPRAPDSDKTRGQGSFGPLVD